MDIKQVYLCYILLIAAFQIQERICFVTNYAAPSTTKPVASSMLKSSSALLSTHKLYSLLSKRTTNVSSTLRTIIPELTTYASMSSISKIVSISSETSMLPTSVSTNRLSSASMTANEAAESNIMTSSSDDNLKLPKTTYSILQSSKRTEKISSTIATVIKTEKMIRSTNASSTSFITPSVWANSSSIPESSTSGIIAKISDLESTQPPITYKTPSTTIASTASETHIRFTYLRTKPSHTISLNTPVYNKSKPLTSASLYKVKMLKKLVSTIPHLPTADAEISNTISTRGSSFFETSDQASSSESSLQQITTEINLTTPSRSIPSVALSATNSNITDSQVTRTVPTLESKAKYTVIYVSTQKDLSSKLPDSTVYNKISNEELHTTEIIATLPNSSIPLTPDVDSKNSYHVSDMWHGLVSLWHYLEAREKQAASDISKSTTSMIHANTPRTTQNLSLHRTTLYQTTNKFTLPDTNSRQTILGVSIVKDYVANSASNGTYTKTKEILSTGKIIAVTLVAFFCLVILLIFFIKKEMSKRYSNMPWNSELRFLCKHEV